MQGMTGKIAFFVNNFDSLLITWGTFRNILKQQQ